MILEFPQVIVSHSKFDMAAIQANQEFRKHED